MPLTSLVITTFLGLAVGVALTGVTVTFIAGADGVLDDVVLVKLELVAGRVVVHEPSCKHCKRITFCQSSLSPFLYEWETYCMILPVCQCHNVYQDIQNLMSYKQAPLISDSDHF